MRFVLASASPRRRELLTQAGFEFEVVPSTVDEESITAKRPEALARHIARAKAEDIAAQRPDDVVLAADTIVVLRGDVLGKPADAAAAREMLARLRGRQHRVITGVCVMSPRRRPRVEHVTTKVTMRAYNNAAVEAFIASGSPFDKAGGYAVQDADFAPVEAYGGCYCNVLGLPLWTAIEMLRSAGVRPSEGGGPRGTDAASPMPSAACDGCFTKPKGAIAPR